LLRNSDIVTSISNKKKPSEWIHKKGQAHSLAFILYIFWIDMCCVTLFMKNRNAALRFCYQRFESVTPGLNNLGTCIHVQY